mgnify:CR=1 FL=1
MGADHSFHMLDRDGWDDRLWQQYADLMYAAFDWYISRGAGRALLEADPRHAVDPVGVYALDGGGDLAGYAGMGRRPVVHGGETLPSANLWVISVRWDRTRRGVGTRLVEMALEQLASEGVEDVTLYSTPGLVAYPIYRSMGFLDHHRLAFWLADSEPGEAEPALRPLTDDEMARTRQVFESNMRGIDGFTVRQGDHYAAYRALGADTSKWFQTIDPPGTLEGFIFGSPEPTRGVTTVTELVGPDDDWYRRAGRAVRASATGEQVWILHRNPLAVEGLEAAGFRWNDVRSYERMMALGNIVERDEVDSDPRWFAESRLDTF